MFTKHGIIRTFKRKMRDRIRYRGTTEEVFTRHYRRNFWGSNESRSGPGSELQSTENIRRSLPNLIQDFGVRRLLDVPCGDFNWMQHVISTTNVEYIGGDIVKELVETNQRIGGGAQIKFIHMDLTRDRLPDADLMLVRDCLFHLSFEAISKFLENFCRAEIRLLLTTSHVPLIGENHDILDGSFRSIHLYSPPFVFPQNPLCRIPDYRGRKEKKDLLLFDCEQVSVAHDNMKHLLKSA